MTGRDLITKLLNYDLDADVVFEMIFDDGGEPVICEVNDVLQLLPDPNDEDSFPLIILTENVETPELDFNLN